MHATQPTPSLGEGYVADKITGGGRNCVTSGTGRSLYLRRASPSAGPSRGRRRSTRSSGGAGDSRRGIGRLTHNAALDPTLLFMWWHVKACHTSGPG